MFDRNYIYIRTCICWQSLFMYKVRNWKYFFFVLERCSSHNISFVAVQSMKWSFFFFILTPSFALNIVATRGMYGHRVILTAGRESSWCLFWRWDTFFYCERKNFLYGTKILSPLDSLQRLSRATNFARKSNSFTFDTIIFTFVISWLLFRQRLLLILFDSRINCKHYYVMNIE